jgi:hypothetical protein
LLRAFSSAFDAADGGGGSDPTSGWLKWLFGHRWGRWVALAFAFVPVGIGIAHLIKGWRASYEKYLKLDDDLLVMAKPICSFGLMARGALFIVVGVLAFYAGGIYDAEGAPGLEDALTFIQGLPLGSLWFLLAALGVLAFALYSFVEAAYRRIGIPDAGFD